MSDTNKTMHLSDSDKKYVAEHLNETEDNKQAALEETRHWLTVVKPELHARVEDRYVLPFLRVCKFDLEKTKERLTNYYTLRRDRSEWFQNRNPLLPEIQELVKLGVFVPLRHTYEGRLVVIIRTAAHDPCKHLQNDVFKTGKMLLDVAAMEEEKAQIYGITAIFDMTNVGLGHARQLTPSMIKHAVFAWQNYHCMPKQLEFVNAPLYINVMLKIFKGFLSAKLKERVRVHIGSVEPLHEVVDKEILPPEYGGEGEGMESLCKYWGEKLVGYRDWFAEDEQYKAE